MSRILLFVWPMFSVLISYSVFANNSACVSALIGSSLKPVPFDFPGLKVASVIDETSATGATLFYFPKGAVANFDSRGGSVAAVETTLLEEGSYSNEIDGIVFAGGSTMGLAATDGVRKRLFEVRSQQANQFDFIPSVPGAVVFDYGGRVHPNMDQFAYPTSALGEKLMDHLEDVFYVGRTGAGINVTSSKVSQPIWGGQGFKFAEFQSHIKIAVAVVVNAGGEIILPNGQPLYKNLPKSAATDHESISHLQPKPGQNTTLSIVITNIPLDRSALKRLAVMVHTNMAGTIRPFHTPTDGDILFAVSIPDPKIRSNWDESSIAMAASEMMTKAIIEAGVVSNTPQNKKKK